MEKESSDREQRRIEARKHFEEMWRAGGNLTDQEIKEYGDFEFLKGPETVNEQLRRYFLLLKSVRPKLAELMVQGLGEVDEEKLSEPEIQRICSVVDEYIHGFIIRYNGEWYHRKGKGTETI